MKEAELEEYLCVQSLHGPMPFRNARVTSNKMEFHLSEYGPPNYMCVSEDASWHYVIDLDREVFTVNNTAHLKLNCIPNRTWKHALVETVAQEYIFLPGMIPDGSLAQPVLPEAPITTNAQETYQQLKTRIIEATTTNDPLLQRHGSLLALSIFESFRKGRQWVLNDELQSREYLCFREHVYAILCIATPDKNIMLWKSHRVLESPEAGYFDLLKVDYTGPDEHGLYPYSPSNVGSEEEGNAEDLDLAKGEDDPLCDTKIEATSSAGSSMKPAAPEFVAHLGVGTHLKEQPSGSSPEGSIYWFEGALVMLAEQLSRSGALEESIVQISRYHKERFEGNSLNGVIISIEHIVLVRISASGQIAHTELLPLFNIDDTMFQNPSAQYSASYLGALGNHVQKIRRRQKAMESRHREESRRVRKRQEELLAMSKKDRGKRYEDSSSILAPEWELDRQHENDWYEEMEMVEEEKERLDTQGAQEMTNNRKPSNPAIPKQTFLTLVNFFECVVRQRLLTVRG